MSFGTPIHTPQPLNHLPQGSKRTLASSYRIAFSALACLFLSTACWYHVPDPEQDDVFPCENDRHCIEGYLCRNGFCTSKPEPENPPVEPAAVVVEEEVIDPGPAFCGNGRQEDLEECDDGDANSDTLSGACRSHCAKPSCGDGVLDPGESCDDGNQKTDRCPYGAFECEVCNAQCQRGPGLISVCGDGVVDPHNETCDDGNTLTEVCPYNLNEEDAACLICNSSCQTDSGEVHYCGDGEIDVDHDEECDPGDAQLCSASALTCTTCWANCIPGQSNNLPPVVAFLGSDPDAVDQFFIGHRGERITLDASPSHDPEGGSLTYAWKQTAGSPVLLHDAHTARPSFVAPEKGGNGLSFELTLTDLSRQASAAAVQVELLDTDEKVLNLLRNPTSLFHMILGVSSPSLDALHLDKIHQAKITQNGQLMFWGSVKEETPEETNNPRDISILAVVAMHASDPFETVVYQAPADNMRYFLSRDFDTALGLMPASSSQEESITVPYFIAYKDGQFISNNKIKDIITACSTATSGSCGAQINGRRFTLQNDLYAVRDESTSASIAKVRSFPKDEHLILGRQKTFIRKNISLEPSVCITQQTNLNPEQTQCIPAQSHPKILAGDILHSEGELLLFPGQLPLQRYLSKPIAPYPGEHAWYAPSLYFRPKPSSHNPGPFRLYGHHTYAQTSPTGTTFFTQKHDLSAYALGAKTQLHALTHRHLVHQSATPSHTILTLHDLQEQAIVNRIELPKSDAPIVAIADSLWTIRDHTLFQVTLDLDGRLSTQARNNFDENQQDADAHLQIHPHSKTATAFFEQSIVRIPLNGLHRASKATIELENGRIVAASMISQEDGFIIQTNNNGSDPSYAAYPLHYNPEDDALTLGNEDTKIPLHKTPKLLDGATIFFVDGSACVLPECESHTVQQNPITLDGYLPESAPNNGYAWYRNASSPTSSRWPILVDVTAAGLRPIRAFERYHGALPPHETSTAQTLQYYQDKASGSLIYRVKHITSLPTDIRCLASSGHCRRQGSLCVAWDAPKPQEAESQLLVVAIDNSVAGTLFYDIRASDAAAPIWPSQEEGAEHTPKPFSCEQ